MTENDLLLGGLKLLGAASPFILITMSITYAGEIIDLVKKAVLGRSRNY